MSKEPQLTKICINCGLKKPMAAYLQISGPEGTSYGNICSTCRGSGLGKSIVIPEKENEEGQSGNRAGLKIDAKTKVQIETEKKLRKENLQELEIKEAKKLELSKEELLERKTKREEAEKQHRQNFIEPKKKDSFLNYQSQKPPQKPITPQEKEAVVKKAVMDQHGILETLNKEEAAKQEEKQKTVDFINLDVDLSQPLEKFRSAEYNKIVKAQGWLRAGAPSNNNTAQPFLANKPAPDQADPQKPAADDKTDPLLEYVNEIFKPNSPGSRRR